MALDFSGQAEPVTPKPAGTLDFSGAAEPVDVVGAGENSARQLAAGGGGLLRSIDALVDYTPAGYARNAVGGLMDFFGPPGAGDQFSAATHPLDTAGRRAAEFGDLRQNEIPEDFTADIAGKGTRAGVDIAGALAGGGYASLPAKAITAARGVPYIGRFLEGVARGAPVAGAMTGIQAANLGDELTPEEKAIEIAKSGGLNLLMAGLPMALTNNPVLRPVTAAGIGAGTSAGVTALAGQDQDAATNIVGALTGLALGGRPNAAGAGRPAGDYITPDMVDAFMGSQPKGMAPDPRAPASMQPSLGDGIIDAEFTDRPDFLAPTKQGLAEPFKTLPAPETAGQPPALERVAPTAIADPETAIAPIPRTPEAAPPLAESHVTPQDPRKRIIDPDERHITAGKQSVAEYAAEHNLTPEQSAAAEKRFVKPLTRDPLTELHRRDELRPTIEAAQQSGEPAVYVETDMTNLGGLNENLGSSSADPMLKLFADTVRAELEPLGGIGMRKGGDELGFVVTGADRPTVEAAMHRAREKFAELTKEHAGIPHHKDKDGKLGLPKGTGLHFATSEIRQDSDIGAILKGADLVVEARKKGKGYERDGTVQTTRTGAPGEIASVGAVEGAGAGNLEARGTLRADAQPEVRAAPETGVVPRAPEIPAAREQRAIADTPDPPLDIRYGKNRLSPKPAAEPVESVAEQSSRDFGQNDAEQGGLHEAVQQVLEGRGDVTYIRGAEGFPARLRKGIEARQAARGGKGRTAALFDPKTGKVYIDTSVVKTPEAAAWNAAHEIAGHKGIRGMLGDKPALKSAMELARQNPTVSKLADAIAKERKSGDAHLMAEEALAELAAADRTGNWDQIKNRYGVDVPEGVRASVKSAIARFVERLKAMLAKAFGKVRFSDAQVRELLEGAWRYVKEGRSAPKSKDGPLFHKAYHGSPHDFDKFTLDKIGTGEGAQAYGHGLYFAGRREVAKYYQKQLSSGKLLIDGGIPDAENPAHLAALAVHSNRVGGNSANDARKAAIDDIQMSLKSGFLGAEEIPAREQAIELLKGNEDLPTVIEDRGRLYEVELTPKEADYLDWDKPLSKQSEQVRAALRKVKGGELFNESLQPFENSTGDALYRALTKDLDSEATPRAMYAWHGGDARAASAALHAAGIPGIRYLDGTSRGKGEGSHNYVIFDDSLVSIEGKENVEQVDDDFVESYSPEQEDFLRKAGMKDSVDQKSAVQKAKDWVTLKGVEFKDLVDSDEAIQQVADRFYGIKKAEREKGDVPFDQSAYIAARQLNLASTMEAVLQYGAPELNNGALRVKPGSKGLIDALEPVKKDMPQFLGWMVAGRAQFLKRQGRENLMTDADIKAGLSLAQGKEAAFKEAAANYVALKKAILDLGEVTGTIDPAGRAVWDHAEYIPFTRVTEDGGFSGPGTRKSLANQRAAISRLKGGENPLADPLGNIIANFTQLVDSAMKNRAATMAIDNLGAPWVTKAPKEFSPEIIPLSQVKKHLLDSGVPQSVIDTMPADSLKGMQKMMAIKAPQGDDVIRVMRNGKPEYWQVHDPMLLESLSGLNEQPLHKAMKPFQWFKQLLTAGATSTPEFMAANALRDTGEASLTSRDRFLPLVDTIRGAIETMRGSPLTRDLMMAGSYFHGGLFRTGDMEDTTKAIRRALRKGGQSDSMAEKVVKSLFNPKRWWDMYRSIAESTEMGSRVRLARNRQNAGGSFLEGAHEAKDLLDFGLRGSSNVVRYMTASMPFLNARIQGAYRLGRVANEKGRRGKMAMRLAALATASFALAWYNKEFFGEAYEALMDWDKDAYWHFAPGTEHHTRIPKPFELGLLAGTLPERMYSALEYQATSGEKGDRPGESWGSFMHALTSTMGLSPPQLVKPLIESFFNTNLFTGAPIEGQGDKWQLPSDRFSATTSATMKAASRGMSATVGEGATLSPKRLEHLWRGYTAGMGEYALNAADMALDWADGKVKPEKALRDYPVAGRFFPGANPPKSTKFTDEFYDLSEKAKEVSGSIKDAEHAGDKARAQKLEAQNKWLLGNRKASKTANEGFMHEKVQQLDKDTRALAKLRKRDQEIYNDKTMNPAAKRAELDKNAAERNAIVRKTVRQLREAERAK